MKIEILNFKKERKEKLYFGMIFFYLKNFQDKLTPKNGLCMYRCELSHQSEVKLSENENCSTLISA